MKHLIVIAIILCVSINVRAEDEKQIHLEDIERDTLIRERESDREESKELAPQPTQHIQLSYSNNPQDVFVTPTPSGNAHFTIKDSPADIRQQVYHLPKVHEEDQTYTVPAKQSLYQPIIGGGQPIHPNMIPQPQYIYIPSQSQAHHPYVSQAHAFVMVPFHHQAQPSPAPAPTPTVYTYSHPQNHHAAHHPVYQKTIEYVPTTAIAPLHTHVDYKNYPTIVPKHTLPSVATTSFRQYYSPGLEYHYTELVPASKYNQPQSYAYHHSPTQNYHTSYAPQQQQQQQQQQYYYQQPSYVPNYVSYQRQPKTYNNHNYYPSASMPQQLFTPASSSSHYASYPSHQQQYNTIAYSVPLPPYDHSKRSTKNTAASAGSVKSSKQ